VCVTGVSGSGKSTLIQDVLYNGLSKLKHKPDRARRAAIGPSSATNSIEDVVMVDQSPIGRTTRSNPASYVGAFDAIRKLFAATGLAKERSYTAGTFSFNSGEGRCPTCGGNGFRARRDAISQRRVPSLSRLRWETIPRVVLEVKLTANPSPTCWT
jgi:excinuclease ABC subunit A